MMRITVVALGDLGLSPRMQYQALALANSGCEVDLVGYRGTACIPEVEEHEQIRILRSSDPLPQSAPRSQFSALRALCRALLQHLQLCRTLLSSTAKPDVILLQTPPAIPTLGVAWLAARLRGAKLVVDWHNFSSAMLALKTGSAHPAVRLTKSYERVLGRLADSHLCVSRAMKQELTERWGIPNAHVLYDRPAAQFTPLPNHSRPAVLRELLSQYLPDTAHWHDDSQRPACLVCPTSWSEDEDLSLLLDALQQLDKRTRADASDSKPGFPNLLVLITGRGPLRERFEARIADLSLHGIEIHTVWLSASDYPRLLAAADLGLCFHRSASGVDLPMKVADMFGAGLPVCAFDYGPCLSERLIDGSNGLLHKGSRQLAEQLQRLFSEFPEKSLELEQLRHGLSLGDGKSWADGWREEAAALLLGEAEKSPHSSPEKSLHVAFFHPNLGIGGAERWLVDAALSLQDAGHRVTIITSHHNPKHCYEETVNGALTVRVRGSFLPAQIGKRLRLPCVVTQTVTAILSTALRRERFDLTFVDLVPHVIPLLRRLGHRNIVYYCHYPDQLMAGRGSAAYQLYRRPINRLEASAVARADRVLVNSHFTADAVRTIFAHLPDRAPEVLHPGVRLPERQAVGAEDSGERMLLSINRFDRKKRIDLAIEAFAALAIHLDTPAIRSTRLVIAGSYNPVSPESHLALRELEALAKELGVADRVTFLKSPSDTARAELLSRCHCLIYTPVAEHFGLVPLEAMAAGRPVIAVRHGGPLETIRDLETGLLCDPTSDAFAEAMARLLSNPAEAQRMGQAGRDWVARRFSLESFANRLTEIVEELVNKEPTR